MSRLPEIRITNCHIHTFTSEHVPRDYPYVFLRLFKRAPFLIKGLAGLARLLGQHPIADKVDRLYQFQKEAARTSQQAVLEQVKKHYPSNTRFVVLPMDMRNIDYGPVPVSQREQHDELNRLAMHPDHLGTVIPFATVNPMAPGSAEEGVRALEELHFRGLKIYPRMGFAPDHHVLMNKVYPVVEKLNRPVMTHCSRGGVQGKWVSTHTANRYTEPRAYIPVMRKFPDMRICLAHFGGQGDWKAYAEGKAPAGKDNWQVQIRKMIGSGNHPNLWTDISYTLFHFDDSIPFLRLFLLSEDEEGERLRSRVLFGSDF